MPASYPVRPYVPRLAGWLLGVGLGGFLDGIVLHQLLQWHSMFSAVDPPHTMEAMRRNMRGDGAFHLLTWSCTLAGALLLRRDGLQGTLPRRGREFAGRLLQGWGAFNLVEGLIDHQLLGIHHVREGTPTLPYDLAFLALGGVALLVAGTLLARGAREATATG